MKNINKLIFHSLLWVFVTFTCCNGQVKTNGTKENATISTVPLKPIMSGSGNVHCSLQDKKGNLWFGTTSQGVYRYDGKSFINFTTKNGLNSNNILSLIEDKNGNIWFGTDAGLSLYAPSAAQQSDALRAGEKIFTHIPVIFADGNNLNTNGSPNNLQSDFVTCILEDKTGKLWFGANAGVFCYDGKAFTRFLDNKNLINTNGLTLQIMQSMLEDKQGNIWFTTKTEGVCCYDGKSLINYKPDGEGWFRGLLEDKNGNIWVGTRYRGVYRYDPSAALRVGEKTFSKISLNDRFDTYTVLSIIQDKAGNIWFGTEAGEQSKRETEGGVWVYDGGTIKNFSTTNGLTHNAVWCSLEDKSGNFWFGTRNTGLSRFNGKTFTSFSE